MLDAAERELRARWGHFALRGAQRRVVLAALRGRDCLAVLPTGAGKSVCYQLPAVLLPGLTVVVSPLVSLMQDQVQGLQRRGVAAAYLSSTQSADARREVLQQLREGRLRLLYLAPERLAHLPPGLGHVTLLAVDEAHCISEWGHDFRPEYRQLGELRVRLGNPPVVAVTATATPATREDISRVLGLRQPVEVVTSFDRPNLSFQVSRQPTHAACLARLAELLRESPGSAVVYAPTRNRTDGLTRVLQRAGIAAAPYHAGLPGPARESVLGDFLAGRARCVVATSAFGMGIDHPDVRLVAHVGIPQRPETYYQQAGRAGRDGKPARCVLFWTRGDMAVLRASAKRGPVAPGTEQGVRAMARYVMSRRCRRRTLLEYLGERMARCAGCDRCSSQRSAGWWSRPAVPWAIFRT